MEQFRQALKSYFLECCRQLAGEPPQFRLWTRVVREKAGQTSFPTEIRPDFSASLRRLQIQQLTTAIPLFNPVVESVREHPRLREVLLTDAGGNPITGGDSQAGWLGNILGGSLLNSYVIKAGGFRFDEGIFSELFEGLQREIESPDITVTELSPLMRVEIESRQIDVDNNLQLRQLSTDEIEGWLNPPIPGVQFSLQPLTFHELIDLQSAIEVCYQQKRFAPFGSSADAHDKVSRLLTAMRLLTDASPSVAFTEMQTSGFFNQGFGSYSVFRVLRLGGSAKIKKSEESGLVELYGRLKSSPCLTKMGLSLARWNSAGDRLTEDDRLIDYWIAFESLFVPDSTQELSYRTALRIAAFLGPTGSERGQIYKHMKQSYDLRSRIVHGSVRKRKKDLPSGELVNVTRSYLRQTLLKMLKSSVRFNPSELEVQLLERE